MNLLGSGNELSGRADEENEIEGSATLTLAEKHAASQGRKFTPLEQQYLAIKKKHPDCLLVVEVGYKYRFFDDDALIASKELHIVAYKDKNMHGASIPTHRLNVHVKKLVQLGYKGTVHIFRNFGQRLM
jgi:DNA mismatch repair protein MSH3